MLLFLGSAAAAPGDLDPTFGTGGVVETAIGSAASARAMVLQPDGKIVLAGSAYPGGIAVARYSPEGKLDPTFGTSASMTGPEETQLAVAIQPDGRIVTAGRNNNTDYVMTVTRYLPNGNIDSAFGSGGVATGPTGDANAVAIQADGKILVAGGSPDPNMGSSNEFTLIRFLSGGTPDPDFGSNGVVRTRVGSSDTAWGLALQANGRIVAGGSGGVDELRMAIARYEPNGELDPTFGANGVVTDPVAGQYAAATSIALDTAGRVVAAGFADQKVAVARYRADGSVDRTFGANGSTTVGSGGLDEAEAIALQPDGRIVVTGLGANAFAVMRLGADGGLDSTFGDDGISRKALGVFSGASAVAVQPDGPILAAGYVSHASETNFVLARYRVTSPTAIHAEPVVVPYGRRITVAGNATQAEPGVSVELWAKGCYAVSERRSSVTTQRMDGSWNARATPRSRTVYRSRIGGDRSGAVIVQVRPRVSIARTSGRVRVRVLFGHELSGEVVALQRFESGQWLDVEPRVLTRFGRTRNGVVSSANFRPRRRGRYRALLRQPNPYACFADAASRAIRR